MEKGAKILFSIDAKSKYLSFSILLSEENVITDETAQLTFSLSSVSKLGNSVCIDEIVFVKIYRVLDFNRCECKQINSDLLFLCACIHLLLNFLTRNIHPCYIWPCCACVSPLVYLVSKLHWVLTKYSNNFFYNGIDLLQMRKKWSAFRSVV